MPSIFLVRSNNTKRDKQCNRIKREIKQMELRILKTGEEAAHAAAAEVAELLRKDPIAILGVSAGHAFVPFYKELVRYHTEEDVSMHRFRTYQSTEYLGLPGTHPMSHRFFLVENFFEHVPAPRRYQKRLPGLPVNMEATCRKFEQRIKSVDGMDLMVVGLGKDGQLGFNEKGTPFDSHTRQVILSKNMREEYARDFPRGAVPRRGITMGIGTMLEARRILVLVTQPDRADALKKVVTGRVSTNVPGTVLSKHPSVVIYTDKKTAENIPASAR